MTIKIIHKRFSLCCLIRNTSTKASKTVHHFSFSPWDFLFSHKC